MWCAFSCANLSGFYNFSLVIPYVLEMMIMPLVKESYENKDGFVKWVEANDCYFVAFSGILVPCFERHWSAQWVCTWETAQQDTVLGTGYTDVSQWEILLLWCLQSY